MSQTRLFLLGDPTIDTDGNPLPLRTKKQQRWIALLSYLAVKQKPVQRERLAQIIWNDAADASERLRKHTLDELKHKIGADLLDIKDETVRLRTEVLWVDAVHFRQRLDEYRMCAATEEDEDQCLQYLESVVWLYKGAFLGSYTLPESEAFYFWQIEQDNHLRQEFQTACDELLLLLCVRSEFDKALEVVNLWKQHDSNNLDVHGWVQVVLRLGEKPSEAAHYVRQLRPMLMRWGKSDADLDAVSRSIEQRLAARRVERRQLADRKRRQIPKLLTGRFEQADFDQAKDNPEFFGGYIHVLTQLADRNPPEAVAMASEIADALFDLKDSPTDAKAVLDHVETLSAGKGQFSDSVRFQLLLQRVSIYRALGLIQQVIDLLDSMMRDFDIDRFDDALKAEWYLHNGLIDCWVKCDYDAALESLWLARHYARCAGQFRAEAGITGDIGLVYWNQGKLYAAREALLEAKEHAALLGNYRTLLKLIGNMGLVALYQGRIDDAYTHIEEHYRLAVDLGHLREIRRARGNRGITRFHMGDYDGAIEDLEACIGAVKAVNEGVLHATVNLSRCYRARGDVQKGYDLAQWALQQAQEKRYISILIIAQRTLADYLPPEAARDLLQQALANAAGKRQIDEAMCLLSLSKVVTDEHEQQTYWNQGARLLEDIGAETWLDHRDLMLPTL